MRISDWSSDVCSSDLYLMLSQIFTDPDLVALTANPVINVATCLVFMAAATFISYRGMDTTKAVQYVLVGFQVVVMTLFGLIALSKLGRSEGRLIGNAGVRLFRSGVWRLH